MPHFAIQDPRLKAEKYESINVSGFPMCILACKDMRNPGLTSEIDSFVIYERDIQKSSMPQADQLRTLLPESGGPYLGLARSTLLLIPHVGESCGHMAVSYSTGAELKFHRHNLQRILVPSLQKLWNPTSTTNAFEIELLKDTSILDGVFFHSMRTTLANGFMSVYMAANMLASGHTEHQTMPIGFLKQRMITILRSGYLSNYTKGLEMDTLTKTNLAGVCPIHIDAEADNLSRSESDARHALNQRYGRHSVPAIPCPFTIKLDANMLQKIADKHGDLPIEVSELNNYVGKTGIDIIADLVADLIEQAEVS